MTRALFLDALGTVLRLDPPWDHLRAAADGRVTADAARAAFRRQMAFYRDHSHEGRDEESLGELRARSARILSDELGVEISTEELMDAIRFEAFPDARPALAGARARGIRTIAVSNWDCSLRDVLARVGLSDDFDGVVTSAEVGARKPDPAVFAAALEAAECEAGEALHVGDTVEEDVEGARAAGIRVLLLDREGGGDISSLEEIGAHL